MLIPSIISILLEYFSMILSLGIVTDIIYPHFRFSGKSVLNAAAAGRKGQKVSVLFDVDGPIQNLHLPFKLKIGVKQV